MRWLMVFLCAWSVERAAARAGTGDGSSKYTKPDTLDGFCTDTNEDEPYYKEGYCQSLAEQFNKNDCMKQTIEKIRKAKIGEGAKKKDGSVKTVSLGFTCSSDPPEEGKDLDTIAKTNPSQFSYILMQWVSMLTAQNSGWDVLKDESNGGKGPGGLLGLSLEKGGDRDMDNPKYACGCKDKVATTAGGSDVNTGTLTVEGQSPGPLDGHHSMTCGSYMIFKSIEEDEGSGMVTDADKPDGPKKPRGVTRILPDVNPDYDPNDKKAVAAAEWRDKKMATFCKQFFRTSTTNPWKRTLPDDGAQLPEKAPSGATSR